MEPVRREPEKKKIYKSRTSKGTRELDEWEREVCHFARALETAFGVKEKSSLHHVT